MDSTPLVNASRAPGNWQSYDILYKAPVFGTDGSLAEPMRLDCAPQRTPHSQRCLDLRGSGRSLQSTWQTPLMIQDHKGTGVSFRNLWIVPDVEYDQELYSFRRLFASSLN